MSDSVGQGQEEMGSDKMVGAVHELIMARNHRETRRKAQRSEKRGCQMT